MNPYLKVHLSVLIIAFIISPRVMAQSAPDAEPPSVPSSANTAALQPSLGAVYAPPISVYSRPTEREKVRLFEFDAFGPIQVAKAALSAGVDQGSNSPPEWGKGWSGFGKRVGSDFGIQVATTTTRYGMAEIFREDTAYYRCECKGFFPRVAHALISTVTARRGEDGHSAFSFSGLASPYAGSMTALAWYPDRFGVQDGFRMGNYNLLAQGAGNLVLEFIYGGPHTLLGHRRTFKSPDPTVAAQNRK
jgi:hypothetical protein